MAAKIDLTFEEINTALGVTVFSASGSDIMMSVGTLTGDTYTGLTDEGIIEMLYKIRSACSTAQETVNETLADGEKLDSFPGFSFSPPADGYVTVTQSQTVRIPLDTATVIGTNI